jgi:hypothetical protein
MLVAVEQSDRAAAGSAMLAAVLPKEGRRHEGPATFLLIRKDERLRLEKGLGKVKGHSTRLQF